MTIEKKPEPKKYCLTLDERQARVVQQALDLYSRIGIGQFEEITNHFRFHNDPRFQGQEQWAKTDLAKRVMDLAKEILFKFGPGAHFGIYSKEVPDTYRVAWDIMMVIRHQFWLDRPKTEDSFTDMGVDAAPVDKSSVPDQPLPIIEKADMHFPLRKREK